MFSFSRLHLLVSLVACAGILQFLASLFLAVNLYAGGTGMQPESKGYSWTGNFSATGGAHGPGQAQTTPSPARMFNRSVLLLGSSLLPFFAVLPSVLERNRAAIWLAGTLSACGLVGIGLTPYDRHFVAHHIALGAWVGPWSHPGACLCFCPRPRAVGPRWGSSRVPWHS